MQDFPGKVAVVTGAASGIGLALATRFASEGMRVVLADVEQPALDAAVTRLRQQEYDVLGVVTDVSSASAVEQLAQPDQMSPRRDVTTPRPARQNSGSVDRAAGQRVVAARR